MNRLLRLVLFGILLCFSVENFAQENKQDLDYELLGLKTDTLMMKHANKGEFQEGLKLCKEKEAHFLNAKSWSYYIQAINDRAWFYHTLDSLEQFKEIIFENFAKADKYIKQEDPQWLRAKEQINSYHYLVGDYKSALEIIKDVIPVKEKLPINDKNRMLRLNEIALTYKNLGNTYNHLKDPDNAISAFKKSISILKQHENLTLEIGERYNTIAISFKLKGELDSALYYLNKSEVLFKNVDLKGRFKGYKFETYIQSFETWVEKENYERAKDYLDLIEKLPLTNKQTVSWYERSARYYRKIGALKKSKEYILKAQDLSKEYKTRSSPPLRAKRGLELVKAMKDLGEEEAAIDVLQEGLKTLAPEFSPTSIYSNPDAQNFFSKPDALNILHEKGRIFYTKYLESDSLTYLEASYETYLVACEVIKLVRQGIRSSDSKNDLSKHTISVYEEAINVAFELFKTSKNNEYVSTAFKLAESNKAQLLLENLNEQEARGYAGIPDSLYKKEKGLRLLLAKLEDKAIRSGVNANSDLIFKTRQELSQFASLLEKSYPRYYSLKYNNEPVEPQFIQEEILDEDAALIEYFVGDDQIFVFVITRDHLTMHEMKKDATEMDYLLKFRNILKNRPDGASAELEYSNFVTTSRQVYQSFVEKALEAIPNEISTLFIIPDDHINYVPFEVLLLEDPKTSPGYSLDSKKYLFEEYALNYNYSATLLSKVISKKEAKFEGDFIGYAPSFADGEVEVPRAGSPPFKLSNLKCNKDEVESIFTMIGGGKKIEAQATKADFLKEAKQYKIIHLATHAFVDQHDSKLNKIFLQDDFLSDVNLYNLELNTELAVLSACNTGSGELLKGEGVMNLARGFINAGCSSTLMSMWSVDDCATADLMLLFYQSLKDGLHKDEALRQAKKQYLTTANKTKLHPYYWAAFVPFGDMKALDLNPSWFQNKGLMAIVGISLFSILFFMYRKKR